MKLMTLYLTSWTKGNKESNFKCFLLSWYVYLQLHIFNLNLFFFLDEDEDYLDKRTHKMQK